MLPLPWPRKHITPVKPLRLGRRNVYPFACKKGYYLQANICVN